MIIKNYQQLGTSEIRKQALNILEAGLESINTEALMDKQFFYDEKKDSLLIMDQKYSLKNVHRVVVVGAGKMAARAARMIEKKMGQRIDGGVVIDIVPADLKIIASRVGTHPLPSSANVAATDEIIQMLNNLTERDLVISIIGGGGSSLLTNPKTVSLEEERKITSALMDAGSDIREMNTVRKHLSQIKGGGLAVLAYPATVISLIFSDVPGDDISQVASGPTVLDKTTMQDAMEIMNKYRILDRCSMNSCGLTESSKDEKYFEKVNNILFCSSKTALKAMENKARDLGLRTKIWHTAYGGEAREIAKEITTTIEKGQCLIAAGESVVTIAKGSPKGSGGRNQEMALSALLTIPEDTVFSAVNSDGRDNSDVAGGMVDSGNLALAKRNGLDVADAVARHDEYGLILDLNAAVMTGVTGSNISDLIVCIRH